jgi:hypothetical protein
MQDLTSAQIMFLAFAGMEDAQITAGNGLVKREVAEVQATSTADYFRARKATRPGTQEFAELQEKRKRQSSLRKFLDGKVKALIQEDMRYR